MSLHNSILGSLSHVSCQVHVFKVGSERETAKNTTILSFLSFSLVHISKCISAMHMQLSETIEGVYVSAYFKFKTIFFFFLSAK